MVQTSFKGNGSRFLNEEFSVWRVWRYRFDFIVEGGVWCPSLVSVIGYHSQERGAFWEGIKNVFIK